MFSVAHASTNPKTAIALATVICHVLSFFRPECHDQITETMPAIRYGGHVSTSVISLLKPSVCTAVGKKFLKPLAAICMCWVNTKTQRRCCVVCQ